MVDLDADWLMICPEFIWTIFSNEKLRNELRPNRQPISDQINHGPSSYRPKLLLHGKTTRKNAFFRYEQGPFWVHLCDDLSPLHKNFQPLFRLRRDSWMKFLKNTGWDKVDNFSNFCQKFFDSHPNACMIRDERTRTQHFLGLRTRTWTESLRRTRTRARTLICPKTSDMGSDSDMTSDTTSDMRKANYTEWM